jgi:hypothetical protein
MMTNTFVNKHRALNVQGLIMVLWRTKQVAFGKIGFVLCAALAAALTGCIGYVDRPRGGGVYAEPPSVYADSGPPVQPEYVYYPGYQVYYSSHTHQYVYRDGRSWVSQPAPPHVSVNVLFASPSVGLSFHDHPSAHHATVVQQYPKNWTPPGSSHGNKEGHRNE